MTSVFDYDDSLDLAFEAKTAGKNLVTAKHEVLTKTGEFLFLAHSDKEFALRCQMVEKDIESAAKRKMATVSDSKFKLVRALHEEWTIRHANCQPCKVAFMGMTFSGPCPIEGCKGYAIQGAPCTKHSEDEVATWRASKGQKPTSPKPSGTAREGSKFAAGEASSLGRAHGESMQCGASEPFAILGCGAINPRGGLGGNTGLCLSCEDKAGFKTPAHDYQGNTRGDVTASRIVEAMAFNLSDVSTTHPSLPVDRMKGPAMLGNTGVFTPADSANAPELKAGHIVMIRHPKGGFTLGLVRGDMESGQPALSNRLCTGSSFTGFPECNCGERHLAVSQFKAQLLNAQGGKMVPEIGGGKATFAPDWDAPKGGRENFGFMPKSQLVTMPEELQERTKSALNWLAKKGGYDINGVHPALVNDDHFRDVVLRSGAKQRDNGDRRAGLDIGSTIFACTPRIAFHDDTPARPRTESQSYAFCQPGGCGKTHRLIHFDSTQTRVPIGEGESLVRPDGTPISGNSAEEIRALGRPEVGPGGRSTLILPHDEHDVQIGDWKGIVNLLSTHRNGGAGAGGASSGGAARPGPDSSFEDLFGL